MEIFFQKASNFHNLLISLEKVPISNTDCKLDIEAIIVKPIPGTALGTQISVEVSQFSVSLSVELPTLINWRHTK